MKILSMNGMRKHVLGVYLKLEQKQKTIKCLLNLNDVIKFKKLSF